MTETIHGPSSLKYLLSDVLWKKFADPCFRGFQINKLEKPESLSEYVEQAFHLSYQPGL